MPDLSNLKHGNGLCEYVSKYPKPDIGCLFAEGIQPMDDGHSLARTTAQRHAVGSSEPGAHMADITKSDADEALVAKLEELGNLWWLVDAPMFVDVPLIDAFHDAFIRPELQETFRERETLLRSSKRVEAAAEGEGEAKFGLMDFLDFLGPKITLKARAELQGNQENENSDRFVTAGIPVDRPERRLTELVSFYLATYPERVLFIDAPSGSMRNYNGPVDDAKVEELLEHPPRPLVFVDIEKNSPILPTFAELETGQAKPIHIDLEEDFFAKLDPEPEYPRESDPDAKDKRKAYWAALKEQFDPKPAMVAVEKAGSKGRIGWIDYRILCGEHGRTTHLHVVPRGRFHTGVFAYNFVLRGYLYGVRLVGMLKAGDDINVLAIYER
jgi:hypothetical protein